MSALSGPEGTSGEGFDPNDEVVARLDGAGAALIVTHDRIVLIREGSGFRPRSGVRSWAYASILHVSLSEPKGGQARIMLQTGLGPTHLISMFFASARWSEAQELVREIHRRMIMPPNEPATDAPGPEVDLA